MMYQLRTTTTATASSSQGRKSAGLVSESPGCIGRRVYAVTGSPRYGLSYGRGSLEGTTAKSLSHPPRVADALGVQVEQAALHRVQRRELLR